MNETTGDLLAFIDNSPTPRHCVAEAATRLEAAGFRALDERDAWRLEAGGQHYTVRDGALIAFRVGTSPAAEAGFKLVGAHTDAPGLQLKPYPNVHKKGYHQLGVEVYGGPLTYTWLDRDLGLAGTVALRQEGEPAVALRLLTIKEPLLRVPSLAIHLNREIKTDGLKLNPQDHLSPVWGLGDEPDKDTVGVLQALIAARLDVSADAILSWDLFVTEIAPPTLGGLDDAFIFAPRLDNQAMCHAALTALGRSEGARATSVICLNDHEEVGSNTVQGAGGTFVEDVLRRIAELEGPGACPGGLIRAARRSVQVSADMAHAVHPSYADRHEPQHLPKLNGGPVIKLNAQRRYATDAAGAALFEALCQDVGAPCQKYVNRTDLPCGSTIGPISSTRLGIPTIDVGNAILSMHSIREQGGSTDPDYMTAVMTRLFEI